MTEPVPKNTNNQTEKPEKHAWALIRAVRALGVQRALWEIATYINTPKSKKDAKNILHYRLRYGTQFAHDLHHNTADDRNEPLEDRK
jgi:hypothetical protein